MKKYVAMVLVLVLILTATACSNNNHALSQIYEVDSGSLADDVFNHENVISDEVVYTQEFPEGQAKTIQVNGESWDVKYKHSLYQPLNNRKVHGYVMDGSEDDTVFLNEDGSIYGGSADFRVLDISKTDTADTVRTVLEVSMTDLVDLSKYEHVDVERAGDENDFEWYRFLFYNTVHGVRSDFVKVDVDSDGAVNNLWINNLLVNAEEQCEGIDKDIEETLIVERLKMIFDTQTTEYRSHSSWAMPRFCIYENELCVLYRLTVHVYDEELEKEQQDGCELLIPVRLLTES